MSTPPLSPQVTPPELPDLIDVNSIVGEDREALDDDEEDSEGGAPALLFVGDIPKDCIEADLETLFSRCGTVMYARVQRSKTTLKPLGYAFVQMATREEALTCIDRLHGAFLRARQIRVSPARRNHTLLVFNISLDLNKDDLMQRFNAFGEVDWSTSTYERLDDYAWMSVPFKQRDQAEIAKREMDTYFFDGRPICIVWYRDSKVRLIRNKARHRAAESGEYDRAWGRPGPNSSALVALPKPVVSIYVTFDTLDNTEVSEALLRRIFERFGTVEHVVIKSRFVDENTERTRGYAFVHFTSDDRGRSAAFAAVDGANGRVADGVLLQVDISNNLRRAMEAGLGGSYIHSSALGSLNSMSRGHMSALSNSPTQGYDDYMVSPYGSPDSIYHQMQLSHFAYNYYMSDDMEQQQHSYLMYHTLTASALNGAPNLYSDQYGGAMDSMGVAVGALGMYPPLSHSALHSQGGMHLYSHNSPLSQQAPSLPSLPSDPPQQSSYHYSGRSGGGQGPKRPRV